MPKHVAVKVNTFVLYVQLVGEENENIQNAPNTQFQNLRIQVTGRWHLFTRINGVIFRKSVI